MAGPIFLDLVKEITIITGTGNVTLLGASGAGFNTFYQVGKLVVGDTFYYVINPGGAEWEVGLGTLLTTTTFSRSPTTSSNAGGLVNFSAGTKLVALDAAAAALTTMLYGVIAIGRIPDLSGLYVSSAAQSGRKFAASPSDGSSGAIALRAIVAADLPALSYVTSVGLTLPSELTVSGSPVTSSGSLSAIWANQTTGKFFAAPNGSTGAPAFRAIAKDDLTTALTTPPPYGATTPNTGAFTTITGTTGAFSDTVTGTKNALGVTPADGLALINSTAAAAGAQQISPALHLQGQGWKTDATAASQAVDWQAYVLPVQGAANPTSRLLWRYAINGGAYSTLMTLDSVGRVGVGTQTPSAPLHAEGDIASSDVFRVVNTNTSAGGGIRMTVGNANNAAALFRAGNSVGDIWAVTNAGNTLMGASMFASVPTARLQVHGAASAITIIARANATGSANIQEWQTSTPTTVALIDSAGGGRFTGLRIDQTPVAATPTPTHTITVNLNGTTYRIPCVI